MSKTAEMVATIPPGLLHNVGLITATEWPVTIVYGDQRLRLAAGESATVEGDKLVRIANPFDKPEPSPPLPS